MIDWQWKCFGELDTKALYAVLLLRQAVFIVEQQSIYHDIDVADESSLHLQAFDNSHQLMAYARINYSRLPLGEVSIGRIIVVRECRGQGLGSILIRECLDKCALEYPDATIKLSAQIHLVKFYEQFGFGAEGNPYDDGGIEHVDMFIRAGCRQ